jgi:hypothetical protein
MHVMGLHYYFKYFGKYTTSEQKKGEEEFLYDKSILIK